MHPRFQFCFRISHWTRAQLSLVRGLANDRSGSVAMMFALVVMVLLLMVGIAVDYGRTLTHREKMLSALDSAVLVAATTPGAADKKINAFRNAFKSQYPETGPVSSLHMALDTSGSDQIVGTASARIQTSFLNIFGFNSIAVGVKSAAKTATGVEFALVLDVSGSMKFPDMSGRRRIDVLKEAAAGLVDTAVANAGPGANLKFGYVPFTMNVNIGASNAGYVTGSNDALFAGTQWAGCVLERAPPNHLSNAYSGSNKWRAYIYPPEPDNSSCDNESNGTNAGYKNIDAYDPSNPNPYTRGPNYNCVRHPIAPLTTSSSTIKTQIASLTAEYNMGTILAPGVTWGARLLTPNAPFSGADAIGGGTKKVMVMLTDGAQTT